MCLATQNVTRYGPEYYKLWGEGVRGGISKIPFDVLFLKQQYPPAHVEQTADNTPNTIPSILAVVL